MADQQDVSEDHGTSASERERSTRRKAYEPPRLKSGDVFERLVLMTNEPPPDPPPSVGLACL